MDQFSVGDTLMTLFTGAGPVIVAVILMGLRLHRIRKYGRFGGELEMPLCTAGYGGHKPGAQTQLAFEPEDTSLSLPRGPRRRTGKLTVVLGNDGQTTLVLPDAL